MSRLPKLVVLRRWLYLLALGAAVTLPAQTPILYHEPYRPQFHFSPQRNWTNDPNGLIYFDGEYHLFFQYNPLGDQWGHMTWGHAVSPDLVHWQELPPAIPEQNGVMIFTGSTVVDQANTSGFCAGGRPCLVAIYTGHTPEAPGRAALQTQNLAYSNDRGRHWTKFAGNPVLDLHMTDFRDPKVIWSPEGRRWVMLVSLPNEHKVRIYGSPDLKHWTTLSDFGPAGGTAGQWECPELFQVPIEGEPNVRRWVLKVGLNPGALQGGSGEQYFVGDFDGQRFINDNGPATTLWTDYGKDCYCALTFNHLPAGVKPVMLGWMDNWQYAKDLPTHPWRGQMTIPRQLTLRKAAGGLRLVQEPVTQLGTLASKESQFSGTVSSVNSQLKQSAVSNANQFKLTASFDPGTAREIGLRLLEDSDHAFVVGYNLQTQKLFVDRTHSASQAINKDFPVRVEAPLPRPSGALTMTVLVDKNSVEVFADHGAVTLTDLAFPPAAAHGLSTYQQGGQARSVSVVLTPLASVW